MTPHARVTRRYATWGLLLNTAAAAMLLFFPPGVMTAGGGVAYSWDESPGFYSAIVLLIAGFMLQLIAVRRT